MFLNFSIPPVCYSCSVILSRQQPRVPEVLSHSSETGCQKSLLDFPSEPECKLGLPGLLDRQLCDRSSGITFFPVSGKPRVLVSSVRHTWHIFPQPTNFSFEYPMAWSLLGIYALHLQPSLFHLLCLMRILQSPERVGENLLAGWDSLLRPHSSAGGNRFLKVLF